MPRTVQLQLSKSSRICERIATDRHGHIVATLFALGANVPRHPPDRRVVEQQGFGHALQNVNQKIVPPDVRELMQQQRLQMLSRQTAERPYWDQYHRTQPA